VAKKNEKFTKRIEAALGKTNENHKTNQAESIKTDEKTKNESRLKNGK
jgi:hypothetical protein